MPSKYNSTGNNTGTVLNPEEDKRVKRTQETLTLLRQAAAIDCTWAECAFYAGINEKTLYEWFKDGEEGVKLRNELEGLRNRPVLKARQELVKGLDNNPELSLKYLERKRKEEFSLRYETKNETNTTVRFKFSDRAKDLKDKYEDL